jgi:hypothetical protein
LLQSPYGIVHEATAHLPLLQVGVPLATLQTLPHIPQLVTSPFPFASQPSFTFPLQSR